MPLLPTFFGFGNEQGARDVTVHKTVGPLIPPAVNTGAVPPLSRATF